MENDIEGSYQIAVQMLNTETNMVWNRYNVFLVANSIIISSIGIVEGFIDKSQPNILPSLIHLFPYLVISGMIICFFGGLLFLYGFYVCSGYNTIVNTIETSRNLPILSWKGRPKSGKIFPVIALSNIILFLFIYSLLWIIPNWCSFKGASVIS